jgi:hypothetical protein
MMSTRAEFAQLIEDIHFKDGCYVQCAIKGDFCWTNKMHEVNCCQCNRPIIKAIEEGRDL